MSTPHAPSPNGLSLPDLEAVYDSLAMAIDATPPAQRELLLVKLALLQAQALGTHQAFAALLTQAQADL